MNRILINHKNKLYYLIEFKLNKFDGSLYFTFDGASGINISYHSSGRINYKTTPRKTIYSEHLANINTPFCFFEASVEEVSKLSPFIKKASSKDVVLNYDQQNICLRVKIAPWDFIDNNDPIIFRYYNLFSVFFYLTTIQNKTISYVIPEKGLSNYQLISNELALLYFHQKLNSTKNMLLYGPNTEGVYTLIFSTQMRIPPRPKILFKQNDLRINLTTFEHNHRTTCLQFKVNDRNGNTIKKESKIKSMELDAEL